MADLAKTLLAVTTFVREAEDRRQDRRRFREVATAVAEFLIDHLRTGDEATVGAAVYRAAQVTWPVEDDSGNVRPHPRGAKALLRNNKVLAAVQTGLTKQQAKDASTIRYPVGLMPPATPAPRSSTTSISPATRIGERSPTKPPTFSRRSPSTCERKPKHSARRRRRSCASSPGSERVAFQLSAEYSNRIDDEGFCCLQRRLLLPPRLNERETGDEGCHR